MRSRTRQAHAAAAESRARPINAERKALLLGTALASTLFVGSVLAPTHVLAESKSYGAQTSYSNDAKLTTGIDEVLPAPIIPSAPQNFLKPDQSLTLTNGIVINNSGDIDPAIAIRAVINNDNIDLQNLYIVGSDTITQAIYAESVIVINNAGNLIADDTGIAATVRNNDVLLSNYGVTVESTSAGFGVLIQSSNVEQVNTLDSVIIIDNDGAINSGGDGIIATVVNLQTQSDRGLKNDGEVDNGNTYNGTRLTQIAEATQTNALVSVIEIDNSGAVNADDRGIVATTTTTGLYLYNGCACGIDNINFGDVGTLDQLVDVAQENVLVNGVAPAEADAPAAAGEAQPGAQPSDQQQTTISTSRGFVDFLATNRLRIALTSYQTGQLMLIGPLLDGRLSVVSAKLRARHGAVG